MSRSAALADAAGVSFEMLGAYIATVSERTRQDAGTIGTALNAIMSRLTSVKQKGFNEEDETKVNDVAKALQSINVQLTDGQGEWRRVEDIFTDVANVWDGLDDKTQNYLATILAGTRQQNVFRTLMADLAKDTEGASRAMELYAGALESAGTAEDKYAIYQDSVTAAHDTMIAQLERLYALFANSEVVKTYYKTIGMVAGGIADLFDFGGEVQTPLEKAIESYGSLFAKASSSGGMNRENLDSAVKESVYANMGTGGYDSFVTEVTQRLYEALAYGLDSEKNAIDALIIKYFVPDGKVTKEVYAAWEDFFCQYVEEALPTAAEHAAANTNAIVKAARGLMSEFIAELAPEFQGQENSIWKSFLGDMDPSNLDENAPEEIQRYIKQRIEMYRQLQELQQMATKGDDEALADFIKLLDTFNDLYDTEYEASDFISPVQNLLEETDAVNEAKTAWEEYAEAVKKANEETATESAQLDAANYLAQAESIEDLRARFNTLTKAQQDWAAKNLKGLNDVLGETESYDDAIKDIRKDTAKLNADHLADLGKVWGDTSKMIEAASKGGDDFNKTYASSVKEAQQLSEAWGALNAIQSGSLTEASDLSDAYKTIASATGLSADSLMNDLSPAIWMLQSDSQVASESIAYLANWLVTTAGIDLSNDNWQANLAALGNSADETTSRVGNLVQALLTASDSSLYLDGNTVKVKWGSGSYTPPSSSKSSSRRSGGGSSNKNKSSSSSSSVSRIQQMVDMMKEIQDLFKFHQSMIQEIEGIYSGRGEYTNLIQVYQEEREAILSNNEVLEENVRKLEELIPSQQALVASMSTSDSRYKDAADDLDRLQQAHQEYSKQLLENVSALDDLQDKIDDAYDAIRQKRITVENMILEAIEDREELEERMLKGRVEMEDEVMRVLKARYEAERDLIIENAELQKEALQQESNLLDENLAKRKERNEQDKKRQQLLEYEQQLARISADPTRKTEQDKLRTKIADLREELAWDTAEEEVKAQKDSIEQQITSLDEYIDYVERYYEDLFNHPKKLIAEVEQILSKTDEEIMAWLKQNDEEYQNSSAATQVTMVNSWQETLWDMRGTVQTHWDEVERIMALGDEGIINFLKQNSAKYREASSTQAQAYVSEWKKNLKDLESAYKETYEKIKAYSYVPIQTSTYSSSGSSGSSGSSSGGGGNKNTKTYSVGYTQLGKDHILYSGTDLSKAKQAYNSANSLTRWKIGFSKGGLAKNTGLAWLDGTPNAPERVLSPYQTELFEDLISTLHNVRVAVSSPTIAPPDMGSRDGFGNATFGDIILNVETLSDDEDYEEVAERVMEEIASRMNFGNVIGGVRF